MRQDRDETVPKFFIRILYEIESLRTFKIETKTLILQWSSVRLLGKLLIVIPLKRGSNQKWNSSRWFPPNCSYGSTDLPAMPATILMSVEFFSAPLRGIGLRGGLGMGRSVPQLLLWIQKQKGSLHTKNGPQICLEPIQKLAVVGGGSKGILGFRFHTDLRLFETEAWTMLNNFSRIKIK